MTSRRCVAPLLLLLVALLISAAVALEFDVGDEEGWVVPKAKDSLVYNHWASKNRFQIGDSVRFKYKKDSVMAVTEEEYEHCRSLHPAFFSNTGDTVFTLDHSGTFYFISGVAGHCERGQKMIIKVLAHNEDAPAGAPPANRTGGTPAPPSDRSSAVAAAAAAAASVVAMATGLLTGSFFF